MGCFSQPHNRTRNQQYEHKSRYSTDNNCYRQLRECEEQQVLTPGYLDRSMRPAQQENVSLSADRGYRYAPYILFAHLPACNAPGVDTRYRALRPGCGTEVVARCIAKGNRMVVCAGIREQRVAASRFKGGHTFFGFVVQTAVQGIEENIRAVKMMPDNQRCRDHEDQALRDPQDNEHFEKKAAHRLVLWGRGTTMYSELIARPTNRLHQIVFRAAAAELSAQSTDMHVQAAIERMELAAKYLFRQFLASDDFSGGV